MELETQYKIYYNEIFPCKELFKILEIEKNREISFFTNQNTYLRYHTFDTVEFMKEKIMQINPRKIDVGPFYNIKPSKLNGAIPIAKELVFDIDLTDYPRNCCIEKTVCEKCYEKIKCAVKLLNYILKNEFGINNFGFVFSGRRGVHCWVFEYKDIKNNIRQDIYKYFQIIIEKNISIKEYDNIMREFGDYDLVKNFFIRIDKQVTVAMNHLIKMPFSIHPDTLNVSIPLDPDNLIELKDIPTLNDVVKNPIILKPFINILNKWK